LVELCTVQILIDVALQIGERGQKPELTGKSPLWRERSALDCSAIEEEEEEEGRRRRRKKKKKKKKKKNFI